MPRDGENHARAPTAIVHRKIRNRIVAFLVIIILKPNQYERQRGRRHRQVGLGHSWTSAHQPDNSNRAIALSLADTKKPEVIDLDSDSEEEDDEETRFQAELQRALEASKTEASRTSHETTKKTAPEPRPITPASVFLSERAQLEKERRERQKRLRPDAAQDDDGDRDGGREDDEPPAKRQHILSSSGVRTDKGKANPASSSYRPSSSASGSVPAANVPTIEQLFWNGEFRQTATRHAEPRKDGQPTFRLTEILGKVEISTSRPLGRLCF